MNHLNMARHFYPYVTHLWVPYFKINLGFEIWEIEKQSPKACNCMNLSGKQPEIHTPPTPPPPPTISPNSSLHTELSLSHYLSPSLLNPPVSPSCLSQPYLMREFMLPGDSPYNLVFLRKGLMSPQNSLGWKSGRTGLRPSFINSLKFVWPFRM